MIVFSAMSTSGRREAYRLQDLLVTGAPAEVPGQGLPNLRVRGIRTAGDQVVRLDQQARRAEPALHGAGLDERLLDRVQPVAVGQALDRTDVAALRLPGRHEARADRRAVEVHRAGAAFALLTGVLGAGQSHPLAQDVQQALALPDVVHDR